MFKYSEFIINFCDQQNDTQMLRSLSTILSSTSSQNSSVTKIYEYQAKYKKGLNKVQAKILKNQKAYEKNKIFQGLLDFMQLPIQQWIIQFESVLNNFVVKQYLYNEIIRHSTSYKNKYNLDSVNEKNVVFQMEEQISHPKTTIHNTFILLNQYKLLDEFIINLNSEELEMLIDGICYIYMYHAKKQENIGQNQQIQTQGNLGTVDEVTCILHYVITHTGLFTAIRPKKQNYSLMKQINILNMPNFVKLYDELNNNNKIDNIINSIPMFMQFLTMMVKHRNNNVSGCEFIINIKWLSGLGSKVLEIIKYNINKILLISNQHTQDLTEEELQIISQLEHMNQVYEKQNSRIIEGMSQKANQLREMDGFVSCQNLFSYSYYHLYSVKFLTKLMKLVLQFSKTHYTTYKTTCKNVCDFIKGMFECAFKYNFNIPESQIKEIQQMVKIISTEGEYIFGTEQKEIKGIQYLYIEQLKNPNLHQFILNLKISTRFSHYFLGRPKEYDAQDDISDEDVQVLLQEKQNLFYYMFNLIYNLKINYLTIVYTMLKNADRRHLPMLQFYFIKNQFLHFLVQDGYSIQTSDKQLMVIYYGCLAYLLKGNMIAYAILDQIIEIQAGQTKKSYFTDTLKRNFTYAKQLLLIVCSDAITANSKNPDKYLFCPQILRRLFFYQKGETRNSVNGTKHQIWISYINTVLIHDLASRKHRQEEIIRKREKYLFKNYVNIMITPDQKQQNQINHRFTKEITEWTTLIIFLHIEFTQYEKANFAEQYVLGKFVMNYLTTILSAALKWKYKDEAQAMKEFLKLLQNWQINSNTAILNKQDNQDIFQTAYGGVIKFMFMKKWNRRIIKAIKLYMQSMQQTKQIK